MQAGDPLQLPNSRSKGQLSHYVQDSGYKNFPHVAPDSIEKATGRLLEYRTVGEDGVRSGKHHFFPGQILYSKIRPNLSKAVVVDFEGLCSADMYPIDAYISARYLLNYILSPTFLSMATKSDTRVAMPKINQSELNSISVPVPPLPEQRRIVAKVDQFMARCDDLDERQHRRTEKRVNANRSALHHLTTATDYAEMAVHWRRIRDHFDLLYDAPETVPELRQAILQLAVRGKLVPQDPSDEPASVLLERIEEEKQRLYEAGENRRPKRLPPINSGEKFFEVPEGWEWVRFGKLIELISGQHLKGTDYNEEGTGIPYLTGPADFGTTSPMASRWTTVRKAVAQRGDVLLTVKGAGIGKINVLAYDEAAISRQLMAIRPILVHPGFVSLLAQAALDRFRAEQVGIAIPGIGRDHVLRLPVGLPPIPEQCRIVERVDQLMALCDELEAKLTASRTKARHLAASVVHHMSAA